MDNKRNVILLVLAFVFILIGAFTLYKKRATTDNDGNNILQDVSTVKQFLNNVDQVYKSAQRNVNNYSFNDYKIIATDENSLPDIDSNLNYCVRFDSSDKPVFINVSDGKYYISVDNLTSNYTFNSSDVKTGNISYSKSDCYYLEEIPSVDKSNLLNKVNSIYNIALQQYLLNGGRAIKFGSDSSCNYKIDIPEASSIDYYVEMNNLGNVVVLEVNDGTYYYKGNDIKSIDDIMIDYDMSAFEISKCN